jgi:crotonobetainyl-CoA:carnitine CoA-transferase CaiB-like acyl-CoA transferase
MTGTSASSGSGSGLLKGIRVVELSQGLAAPILGTLLADQGATVVRIVPADEPADDPVLDAVLARGKRDLPLRPDDPADRGVAARLIACADVFVTDLGASTLFARGIDLEAIRRGPNPRLVSCAIPAFPAGDSRQDLPAGDASAGAAGCLYERMLGSPRLHDLPVPSVLAALFAASGVAAALIARHRDGVGQHVESSLYESSLFAQILLVFMKTGVPRGFVPLKLVATPFMRAWRCKDGRYAYLHITLPAHNAQMIETLEASGMEGHARRLRSTLSAETVRDPSQVGSIGEARRIIRVLEEIFLERSADEWEATLGKHLCCIKVRTIEEWLEDSVRAGMVDAAEVDDPRLGKLLVPGAGVVCHEHPPAVRDRSDVSDPAALLAAWEDAALSQRTPSGARAQAASTAAPLAGIRVADLSRIIAGPCAARVLAELGADVTSFQGTGALDWALSFHLLFNAGKRSVALDTVTPEGRATLSALLNDYRPDAVVQNYRHLDVARTLGVGPEDLRARFPGLVYTHLNAYGDQGAWQERPGFEQVVQAVSGIQMSYGDNGKPRLITTPVIDIGSGLAGAFATLLGLYHKMRTGQGVFVTTHLTWVAVLFQILQVAAGQRGKCLDAARSRGVDVRHDTGAERVQVLARIRGEHAVIEGPRRDVAAWLASAAGAALPADRNVLKAFRGRSIQWLRSRVAAAGLSDRIAVVPLQKARRLVTDLGAQGHPAGQAPVLRRRDYPGSPIPLAYLRAPLALDRTPLSDAAPPPRRGGDTAAFLARIGVTVPPGTGVAPYPADKPYIIWLFSLVRWGLFAWRSGSV